MSELAVVQQQMAELTALVMARVGPVKTGAVVGDVLGRAAVAAGGGQEAAKDDDGLSGSSGSSWADEVEAEESKKKCSGGNKQAVPAVTMPNRASDGVRPAISFQAKDEEEGFFATYVRTPEVKALSRFLRANGIIITKQYRQELALARYSTATVPAAFADGAQRLRSLAKVGDAVLTAVLSDRLYHEKVNVSGLQARCAQVLARSALSSVAVKSGLARFVSFPANVDRERSSVAGEALEAIAGVVYHSCGMAGVDVYLRFLNI